MGQGIRSLISDSCWSEISTKKLKMNEVLSTEGDWNLQLFTPQELTMINGLQKPPPFKTSLEQDRFIWIHTNDGDFSVATASSIIHNRREPGFPYHLLWHSFLPNQISFLARCALFHRLPVDTEIQGLGIPLASKCTCCSTPSLSLIFFSQVHRPHQLGATLLQLLKFPFIPQTL